MKQNRKSTGSLIVWLGALMVILIAAYFAAVMLLDRAGVLTHTEDLPPAPEFIHNGEPVIETIARLEREDKLSLNEINRRLPDPFELLLLGEDINANGYVNYVVIAGDPDVPELSRSLRDVGYTHTFYSLAVYELRNRTFHPVLLIDNESIRDANDRRLIDQVPAAYGYAFLMESFENDALYDAPVQLLEIVMLNERGREASDDITIYWDPSDAAFKATNTFGAP